jgi:hypothetical protein
MFAVSVIVAVVVPTAVVTVVLPEPSGDGHETYTVAEPVSGPPLYSVTVKFTAPVYT